MTEHDAIYAVALHWYWQEMCLSRGERLTLRAAENVREIAAALQIFAGKTAAQLGFDFEADSVWSLDALRIAKSCVKRSGNAEQVRRLCAALADLTVVEIEAYSEAYP